MRRKKIAGTDLRLLKKWTPWWGGGYVKYLYEEPAGYRYVLYKGKYYYIWLPWLYYESSWNEEYNYPSITGVYLSPKQARDKKAMLHEVPLPNIEDGVAPCYPSKTGAVESPTEGFLREYKSFWMSDFNDDVGEPPGGAWENIAAATGADPEAYRKVLSGWESLPLATLQKINWKSPHHTIAVITKETK